MNLHCAAVSAVRDAAGGDAVGAAAVVVGVGEHWEGIHRLRGDAGLWVTSAQL